MTVVCITVLAMEIMRNGWIRDNSEAPLIESIDGLDVERKRMETG